MVVPETLTLMRMHAAAGQSPACNKNLSGSYWPISPSRSFCVPDGPCKPGRTGSGATLTRGSASDESPTRIRSNPLWNSSGRIIKKTQQTGPAQGTCVGLDSFRYIFLKMVKNCGETCKAAHMAFAQKNKRMIT